MSEETNAAEETEEAPKKGKKKLFLILIALNVVVLGGLGAFVLLGSSSTAAADTTGAGADDDIKETEKDGKTKADDKGGKKKDAKDADGEEGGEKSTSKAGGEGMLGPTETIGKFTINLADRTTIRYLRVVLKVEVTSETTVEEVKNRNPQLRHITITYLSSLRLKDTQGPGALDRTRAELERRFNHVLTTGEVKQVYFTDFVTQ